MRIVVSSRFIDDAMLLTSSVAVGQLKMALISRIGAPLVAGDILTISVLALSSSFIFLCSLFMAMRSMRVITFGP